MFSEAPDCDNAILRMRGQLQRWSWTLTSWVITLRNVCGCWRSSVLRQLLPVLPWMVPAAFHACPVRCWCHGKSWLPELQQEKRDLELCSWNETAVEMRGKVQWKMRTSRKLSETYWHHSQLHSLRHGQKTKMLCHENTEGFLIPFS